MEEKISEEEILKKLPKSLKFMAIPRGSRIITGFNASIPPFSPSHADIHLELDVAANGSRLMMPLAAPGKLIAIHVSDYFRRWSLPGFQLKHERSYRVQHMRFGTESEKDQWENLPPQYKGFIHTYSRAIASLPFEMPQGLDFWNRFEFQRLAKEFKQHHGAEPPAFLARLKAILLK
ncbi:MAG: hypothetical protein V1835_04500 [Candidatus Micrarchaeota archaeon]